MRKRLSSGWVTGLRFKRYSFSFCPIPATSRTSIGVCPYILSVHPSYKWGPKNKFSLQAPVTHPSNCFPPPGFGLDHCRQLVQRQGTSTFPVEFTPRFVPERQYGEDLIWSGSSCLARFSSTIWLALTHNTTLRDTLREALNFVKK